MEYANSNMSGAGICAESPKQKDCMSRVEIEMYIDNGGEGNIPGVHLGICQKDRFLFPSQLTRGRNMTNEKQAKGGKTLAFSLGS